MTWEKIKPYQGKIHQGCANCPPVENIAPMTMPIGVGFGIAQVTKEDQLIFAEDGRDNFHAPGLREALPDEQDGFPLVQDIEKLAAADPDHDWQICLFAPLRGRTYQRHGKDKWVLIESNRGFA
jgi:hypothetical protein